MFRTFRTKRFRVALGVVVALSATGAALAYFTGLGAGTGNAQAGTSSPVTLNATINPGVGGILPGGNPAAVTFSAVNPGSGKQYVGTVTLTGVQAFSDSAHTTNISGTGAGKCDTTAFTMAAVTENQNIPPGTTALSTPGSLVFADSGANQDGCKSAYLVASYTSN